MIQKTAEKLFTSNEEVIYFLMDIIPNTKTMPELNKFWPIFKKDPSIIENQIKIPDTIKKANSLFTFLKFYHAINSGQKNKAILLIENFINNEIYDEFYLYSLIWGIKNNLDVKSYFDIDDQYISNLLKSYHSIKLNDFDTAFNLLAEIDNINRLYYLKEILYLQCAIEKGLYDEADNIFSLLFQLNRNNNTLKKLYIYYLLRKSELNEAQKYIMKLFSTNKNFSKTEKSLYLYNLIESKQYDKAISFLKKIAECDEDYFLLARLYHTIGLLDEAYYYYNKIDDIKFPANKMKGIIFFQMGNIEKSINAFNEEKEKRFNDTDLIKIIRFLEIKKRWHDG